MSGTRVSKGVQLQLRTVNIQDDHQHKKMKKTSKKVRKLIHFLTIREVAEEAGISKTMCHEILTENFGLHHVAAKFVPCPPNEDQKQNRADVSKELVNCANADENFLKHRRR